MKRNKLCSIASRLCIAAVFMMLPVKGNALGTYYYKTSSVLSSGNWVKVKVDKTGMQEISFDDLRAAGFSNPENVAVYGFGGVGDRLGVLSASNSYMDDLRQTYSETYGDKLVFYGEAGSRYEWNGSGIVIVHENFDCTSGYYFLTDSHSREQKTAPAYNPSNRTTEGPAPRAVSYLHPLVNNFSEGGARLCGDNLISDGELTPRTVTISLPEYLPDTKVCASVDVHSGGTEATMRGNVTMPGVSRDFTSSWTTGQNVTITSLSTPFKSVDISRYDENTGTAEMDVVFTPGRGMTILAYENILAGYFTRSVLGDASYRVFQYYSVNTSTSLALDEPGETARVWSVTSSHTVAPVEIYTDPESGKRFFGPHSSFSSSSNLYKVVLFDPARELNKATVVGQVANQNIHGSATPGMVIIASPEFLTQAQRLADAHRAANGLTTLVVTPQQVYNEFSSGTPSVNAYRRMAKMFYDRDLGHNIFKFITLFGPATYDQRLRLPQFSSMDHDRLVMTLSTHDRSLQVSKSTSHASDNFIGMLDDDTGYNHYIIAPANGADRINISVGRIPAVSEAGARGYVDKAVRYLNREFSYSNFNRAVLISDDGDKDSHMQQSQEIANLITASSPATTVTKIYNSIYPWENKKAGNATKALGAALSQGVSYLCFLGHGRPDALTAEYILNKSIINSTSYPEPPFMFFATCDVFGFDRFDDNICEALLYKADGGALALVGCGRTAYQEMNQLLNKAFANEIFRPASTENKTYGDAFRVAVNRMFTEETDREIKNTLCYNFGGDPALPVYHPNAKAFITEINGETPGEELSRLTSGKLNTLKVDFTVSDNDAAESFNGWADVAIYEASDVVPNLYQDGSNADSRVLKEITRDETLLISRRFRVTDGKLNEKIFIPAARTSGEANRLTIAAISDSRESTATAWLKTLTVVSDDEAGTDDDTTAPEISGFYIHSENFADGDVIPSSAYVHATISDDMSGIVLFNSALGVAPRLSLDNSKAYSDLAAYVTVNEDGTATLSYPLSGLVDGRHTLRLLVNDYAGNVASEEISFTVVDSSVEADLTVSEEVAREELTFTLSHTFAQEEPAGRLVIEKNDGTPVFTRQNISFPYTWNLCDSEGNLLPSGRYRAKAFLNTSNSFRTTNYIPFDILNVR